jgi:hypothetical protein
MLFAKDFGNFCFPKTHCRPLPPPRGALEWKGAQILEYTPPQPETGWHGPAYVVRTKSDHSPRRFVALFFVLTTYDVILCIYN